LSPIEADPLIREAMIEKRIVEFDYNGYHRIAEIHVYGRKNGALHFKSWSTKPMKEALQDLCHSGGVSTNVLGISNMKVLNGTFQGRRQTASDSHSAWDEIFLLVE
jgi:hypothetical protein